MTNRRSTEYTKEFQEAAIKRASESRNTVASVSRELKIPAWKLRNWMKQSREKLERSPEMDDYERLLEENERLKEEVEILKKAAAYFAKALL
jgi:transposase